MDSTLNRTWHLFSTAAALMSAPESRAVFLFGSGACSLRSPGGGDDIEEQEHWITPRGNDLDLIVTVDTAVYDTWTACVTEILQGEKCDDAGCGHGQDAYHSCRSERLAAALKLLGAGTFKELAPLYGWLDTLDSIVPLDVHLMPADWQDRLDEIQQHLPHKDDNFMQKIATDAILLADRKPESFEDWETALANQLERISQEAFGAEFEAYYESLLRS